MSYMQWCKSSARMSGDTRLGRLSEGGQLRKFAWGSLEVHEGWLE